MPKIEEIEKRLEKRCQSVGKGTRPRRFLLGLSHNERDGLGRLLINGIPKERKLAKPPRPKLDKISNKYFVQGDSVKYSIDMQKYVKPFNRISKSIGRYKTDCTPCSRDLSEVGSVSDFSIKDIKFRGFSYNRRTPTANQRDEMRLSKKLDYKIPLVSKDVRVKQFETLEDKYTKSRSVD
ncbi:unnamed protein product [Moneuplotes crassus]|uniref:Uncharacterized protein n=1 Tax=Euplotes crassus TaxID=5936 RepID=A0AAD1X6U1_EUPCR|nr:unnamed protein product [Moneuplotes crassus]